MRQVKYYFASDTSNAVCSSSPFNTQYDYHGDSAQDVLSTNALFIYSNASLTESSQNGARVEMHVIHYVGVGSQSNCALTVVNLELI